MLRTLILISWNAFGTFRFGFYNPTFTFNCEFSSSRCSIFRTSFWNFTFTFKTSPMVSLSNINKNVPLHHLQIWNLNNYLVWHHLNINMWANRCDQRIKGSHLFIPHFWKKTILNAKIWCRNDFSNYDIVVNHRI